MSLKWRFLEPGFNWSQVPSVPLDRLPPYSQLWVGLPMGLLLDLIMKNAHAIVND